MWKTYAVASAFFAALTAIFAKLGVRDVNSDLATAIRTLIILFLTWGIVLAGNHLGEVRTLGKTPGYSSFSPVSPPACPGSSISRPSRTAMCRSSLRSTN